MEDLKEKVISAIKYALEEIDSYRIDYCVAEMDRCRCPASMVDRIADELLEKMNEWAADNELPEYFWDGTYDEDDLIYLAYDLVHEDE